MANRLARRFSLYGRGMELMGSLLYWWLQMWCDWRLVVTRGIVCLIVVLTSWSESLVWFGLGIGEWSNRWSRL